MSWRRHRPVARRVHITFDVIEHLLRIVKRDHGTLTEEITLMGKSKTINPGESCTARIVPSPDGAAVTNVVWAAAGPLVAVAADDGLSCSVSAPPGAPGDAEYSANVSVSALASDGSALGDFGTVFVTAGPPPPPPPPPPVATALNLSFDE